MGADAAPFDAGTFDVSVAELVVEIAFEALAVVFELIEYFAGPLAVVFGEARRR